MVEFRSIPESSAQKNDECVIGLDVGSTTTKAVLLRTCDSAIVASVYLRTSGDPIAAAKQCYEYIDSKTSELSIRIIGLGVTGSGRNIVALHALTDVIVNEIIAHATAAAFFDPEVDTIFEIGGQDAKYTFLTAGTPSDYAMNEACSAGTGSFLEEAAYESLNIKTEDIADLALAGTKPPDFTDQCSAFISSDIKRASQEHIGANDILGGLVYSVCMNYLNRVKGNRQIGKKIFMQGGVCYNKAVPVAMAALLKTPIIVPPQPGLMGAFGVALDTRDRLAHKSVEPQVIDCKKLIARDAVREGTFVCAGGSSGEKCDRKCEIARIRVDGKMFAFGGACDRYYSQRFNKTVDTATLDFGAIRASLLYNKYLPAKRQNAKTVGLNRSFLFHSYSPLFASFFDTLGFSVIYSDEIDKRGVARTEAAFCLPAEIAHGGFIALLNQHPDYIFMPQVMQLPVPNVDTFSRLCVFVQGETYFLQTTFRSEIEQSGAIVLAPVLKMENGYEQAESVFVECVAPLGIEEKQARRAYRSACKRQYQFEKELREQGKKALEHLDAHPEKLGVVIFGRPYSAFAAEANMGIMQKVASRDVVVIPHDMLDADAVTIQPKMFWAMGQKILKSAHLVKERNNLFGLYITNFSCGPDSFLLNFFRTVMGDKPSLTLELDQHTADAGLDTRIEAAIDIMNRYKNRVTAAARDAASEAYRPATVVFEGGEIVVVSSAGTRHALTDPAVELVLPSMGFHGTQAVAAIFRSTGINARALSLPDKEVLRIGRSATLGKECLPYIMTTGSFVSDLNAKTDPDKITLMFLATGGGPCRLGQYNHALTIYVTKNRISNAAVFTMTDENGYAGLGVRQLLRSWQSIVVADVMQDIGNMLMVTAIDPVAADTVIEDSWKELYAFFEGTSSIRLSTLLSTISRRLKTIPLMRNPVQVPVVSVVGEIFVRREEFSRKNLVEFFQQRGFMVRVAPLAEYICYSNFVINSGLGERKFSLKGQLKNRFSARMQEWWERRIKQIFATSGLYGFEMIDVPKTIRGITHIVNENFRGECILTIGLALREILHDSCGIVSIGPFGCMPSRMAEAILKKEMNPVGKARMPGWSKKAMLFAESGDFPFMSIETDGSPFPQTVEASLEAFVLQSKRLHRKMAALKGIPVERGKSVSRVAAGVRD